MASMFFLSLQDTKRGPVSAGSPRSSAGRWSTYRYFGPTRNLLKVCSWFLYWGYKRVYQSDESVEPCGPKATSRRWLLFWKKEKSPELLRRNGSGDFYIFYIICTESLKPQQIQGILFVCQKTPTLKAAGSNPVGRTMISWQTQGLESAYLQGFVNFPFSHNLVKTLLYWTWTPLLLNISMRLDTASGLCLLLS